MDQFNRPALAVYRQVVNKPQQESLQSSSTIIRKRVTATTKRKDTIHIGWWCRYKKRSPLHRSGETRLIRKLRRRKINPRYTLFWKVKKNRQVFALVDKYFRETDEKLFNDYAAIVPPRKRLLGKSYLMCALNFHRSEPHHDCKVSTWQCIK